MIKYRFLKNVNCFYCKSFRKANKKLFRNWERSNIKPIDFYLNQNRLNVTKSKRF